MKTRKIVVFIIVMLCLNLLSGCGRGLASFNPIVQIQQTEYDGSESKVPSKPEENETDSSVHKTEPTTEAPTDSTHIQPEKTEPNQNWENEFDNEPFPDNDTPVL